MNSSFIKKCLLCAAAVCTLGGTLSAQTTEKARLGYCVDRTGGGLIAQTDQPAEYHAAIRLPNRIMSKYVGGKITTIDFAITEKVGNMMTVFITRELSKTPIVSQQVYDFQAGWNSIKLNKPYTVKEGDDLYVGYIFYTTNQSINAKVITFEFDKGQTPGVNFYGDNGRWYDLQPTVEYDLSIRAYVEADNLPHQDVQVTNLQAADIIGQNVPTSAEFKVWNFGLDTVENLDIEVSANGEVFNKQHLEGVFVEHNAELLVRVDDISFPEEGNNNLEVKVTKVNGHDDSDMRDNTADKNVFAAKEGAIPARRHVLFEQFSSEEDQNKAAADVLYAPIADDAEKAIWIQHHIDDRFTLDKANDYARFFDNNRIFYPAVLVDRNIFSGMEEKGPAYFVGYAETAESMVKSSLSIPSYIAPKVALSYNRETRKLHIEATGEASVKEMPYQQDLRLTVYVVEDGIEANAPTAQEAYTHNGVVRAIVGESCWGEPIDVSSYNFSKTYDVDVDESWNADNLRVVAVVSNYNATDNTQLQVYNSAQQTVAEATGIADATTNSDNPEIWVVDGRVQVAAGHQLLGVYDLSGKRSPESRLTPGIYVVSTTDGTTTHHQKIIVR